MEKLKDIPTEIMPSVAPTVQAYTPLLLANAAAIRSTKRKTYAWGTHARQALDVYFPSKQHTAARAPVLLFLYGGGLVRGSKQSEFADGLPYANLGHFFGESYGYTTVIADYRLLEHGALFPSGGEDTAGAVDWICNILSKRPGYEKIDLFLMGNSAGGIHVSTYLYCPEFRRSRQQIISSDENAPVKLRGVVHLSVPFSFGKSDPSREKVLSTYFKGDIEHLSPHGLFRTALESGRKDVVDNVQFLVLNGTLDDEKELFHPLAEYRAMWKQLDEASYNGASIELMEGHNHISPCLALGTGITQEEVWGRQVGDFCDTLRK